MSAVGQSRKQLEAQGEYVVLANAESGWFAVFPKRIDSCSEAATASGRKDFNLIVYRTRSQNDRDHYVIPFSRVSGAFTQSTLSKSAVDGVRRWNCTLRNGLLHVTHSKRAIDVQPYYGQSLVCEVRRMAGTRLAEEVLEGKDFREGNVVRVAVNRYERDAGARDRCVRVRGTSCAVCGFDFGRTYGSTLDGFIHVHHVRPLHTIGTGYVVDPEVDMVPVCPNCHAAIHSQDPPLTVQAVRELLARRQG